ncbi:hypothetical protein ACEPAG_3232 [Sanghuangporus baumii]
MDGNVLSIVASTVGLVAIAGIGISSSLRSGDVTINPGFRITSIFSSTQDVLTRIKTEEVMQLVVGTCTSMHYGVTLTYTYVEHGIACLVRFARAIRQEYQYFNRTFPEVYGCVDWRNFCKLLRIFKVWEPLPYDLLVERQKDDLMQQFDDRRHEGFVGVCLRFRVGHISVRNARTECGRYLHDRHISVPAFLPLEKDGSLRVDLIREEFFIEEIELLIPGRYEVHRVTRGDVISPFMLHELTQEFDCVNVVEYEDIYCMHRRAFREWLRNSKLYYCTRVACYLVAVSSIALSAIIGSIHISYLCPSKLWACMVDVAGMALAAVGVMLFFEYRRSKYRKLRRDVLLKNVTKEKGVINVPWHTFPARHPPYRLSELGRSYFL